MLRTCTRKFSLGSIPVGEDISIGMWDQCASNILMHLDGYGLIYYSYIKDGQVVLQGLLKIVIKFHFIDGFVDVILLKKTRNI